MRAALVVLALLALAPLTIADPYPQTGDCDSTGQPALHRVEVFTGSGVFYVDDENYALGNGIWFYQETNGVYEPHAPGVYLTGLSNADLQRGGGADILVPGDTDICSDDSGGLGPDSFVA